MHKLYFTTGSPFARAVRIILAEKGLPFDREETYTTPSVEERARGSPTLQVPTLLDGDLRLWDSAVILEYLMASYPNAPESPGHQPFAGEYVRPDLCGVVHAEIRVNRRGDLPRFGRAHPVARLAWGLLQRKWPARGRP